MKIEEIKKEYPELFEEKKCEICNKSFYLTNCQIINFYKKLKSNKKLYYYCSRNCCTKLYSKILGNPFSRKDIIEKIRQTKLNNIDEYGLNSFQRAIKKGLQTKRSDIDENGLDGCQRILVANRKKCLEKYGVDNPFKSKDKKLNGRATKLQRYGNENFTNREKAFETNRNNHNGLHNWSSKNSKLNGRKTKLEKYGNQFYNNREKVIKTCLEKYGTKSYFESQEFKNKMNNKENIMKRINSCYETKKKNNSFHTSKPEDKCYNLLLIKFNKEDIIRQYKSNLYPFSCDFYIKSLNLYIECNFFWTHGKQPFNSNNPSHIKRLQEWKDKNTQFYKNAVYVWTNLDVRKLQTFKNNKLNYKIFYKEEEFNEWIKSI